MEDAASTPKPHLVTREDDLGEVVARMTGCDQVAFDLESNGLFAYRARVCVVQLAACDEVAIVDTLATGARGLAPLLESTRAIKIVHDVAFDARMLAEEGVRLANVKDTSICARMLGRTATGLASLLASELGLAVDKKMQQHDWAERPLDARGVAYLAGDVLHLEQLAAVLFDEAEERGILAEIDEETRYRLAQAIAAAGQPDPRPSYLRLKGVDKAPEGDLPVLRRLAELREERARALDVPPYKVLAPDVLFAIAHAKPRSMGDLSKIRGATAGRRAQALAKDVLRAVALGLQDGAIPEADRAALSRPRLPSALARARRAREQHLMRWRKEEAKRRGVDEQVVLPGHCLKALTDVEEPTLEAVESVPGIGGFRVARDGAAILAALSRPETSP
jgi:ribonuclease D